MAHLVDCSTLHEVEQERRSLSRLTQEAREIRVTEWSEPEPETQAPTQSQCSVQDESAVVEDELAVVGEGVRMAFWHGNGRKMKAYTQADEDSEKKGALKRLCRYLGCGVKAA
ncbi:hypothetical protein PtrSN002B_006456 [Pyrenophora tritici-repentis]|uniref:Uncharacterized protein n=2 Tax=Pyrenophora tritici-repentis TaxID=45151 RepID=A0A2W1D5Q7_9PLEO|nr:uncharacterized protein PTRG_08645 [Pyrenophora tritici-repentis Pt-1C-BFP]KAA8615405.1 hypothetical protein PtrV1_10801 [Pyrenophora tritici-repentis]EDU51564.1 predicted protein [Pyrenophora tritici-repentis Pt-1C-BFP]KAF7444021.1 hypothetical protein A1F99_120950 [Pyrenophora tritici-repentis]KAF7566244.1 hypothetical protein PtrM4_145640 [Pyrenophora tritici-repentis]KAG9379759.1 hypothetical protein A1F94_010115 [Pyrenophora tritici-repentis]